MNGRLRMVAVGLIAGLHAAGLYWLMAPHYTLPGASDPARELPPIWTSSMEWVHQPPAKQGISQPELRSTQAALGKAISARGPLQEQASIEPTYFDVDQLDKKAEPVGEWVVDTRVWPHTPKSVKIEFWVSDKGLIDRWNFLDILQPSPELIQFLQPLPHTLMNPAWRQGKPVPSRLRVELLLDA